MPVYEYTCETCGKMTEELRRMADADAPATCEHCGGTHTKRAHSVFTAGAAGESSLPLAGTPGAAGMGGCCPCGNAAGPCNTR